MLNSTLHLRASGTQGLSAQPSAHSAPAAAAKASAARASAAAPAPVPSATLLQGHKTVAIAHNGMLYTLQATKLGKLILTK
jgi:hemin uptake protein HemP